MLEPWLLQPCFHGAGEDTGPRDPAATAEPDQGLIILISTISDYYYGCCYYYN